MNTEKRLQELEEKKTGEDARFYSMLQDVVAFLDIAQSSYQSTNKKMPFNKFLEKAFAKLITGLVEEYKLYHIDSMEFSEAGSEEFTVRFDIKEEKTLRVNIAVGKEKCELESYEIL